MAANVAIRGGDAGLTRQSKVAFEMALRFGHLRQGAHSFNDFDHALFAFALLAAGCGHIDPHGFGEIEQGSFARRLD
jgi:hypothetical protein